MQEEQGGFETDEMLVIRDAKRLKSFFSKINRTRKPGLPVPDIDFLKDMIIIQCSDGKSQSNTTFLSVVKETDTQIILISNGPSNASDTEKIKSYGSFSIYKMPSSTKEILLDKQINSWVFGLGYNFVDDSGDTFDDLTAISTQWNALAYPNRLSAGRYFKSGLGVEAIATFNKYKVGKVIDQVINTSDKNYLAIDARLSYDLNKLIGQTAWFDPYLGVGTNHIQHAAGIVYQFGIEKELSRKGEAKLALLEALEKEKKRINDSIATSNALKEAEALAQQLAKEKETATLAAIEKDKVDKELDRKQKIEKAINDLGYVYFDLNSSFLNTKSKAILNKLLVVLEENPELELKGYSRTRILEVNQNITNGYLKEE
ncbi:hypothetical protein GQR58_029470 [Nymphon striatum]|nr:hypothetical protein GQR58_029470 [Nymphon striatum]